MVRYDPASFAILRGDRDSMASLERIRNACELAAERAYGYLEGPLSMVMALHERVSPVALKAFHWGFIPFVILLGMRTEPRPKLIDLLSPM